MASIFTKIINGEIPAFKIAETEKFLAFLDVFPIARGHTLVIPKREVDYIFDLDTDEYRDLWSFAREVGRKVGKAMPCERVGISVIGLEVPHAHIHLVPINSIDDLNFTKPKLSFSDEEMKGIAETIKQA